MVEQSLVWINSKRDHELFPKGFDEEKWKTDVEAAFKPTMENFEPCSYLMASIEKSHGLSQLSIKSGTCKTCAFFNDLNDKNKWVQSDPINGFCMFNLPDRMGPKIEGYDITCKEYNYR